MDIFLVIYFQHLPTARVYLGFFLAELAEFMAGYMDCLEEALRYLKEVEEYPEEHPVVQLLRNHMVDSRQKIMDQALMLQA